METWINYVQPFLALTPQQVLALTAYAENRSGGVRGMQSVINVIQNRCMNPSEFADPTILAAGGSVYYAVCLKYEQFSSFNLGDPNRTLLLQLAEPGAYTAQLVNDLNLRTADSLVKQLMAGTLADITYGSNFYFAGSIQTPVWALSMKFQTKIQGQLFYAAAPYISQNPQVYIQPIDGNDDSTVLLAPNLVPPQNSTANPEALGVTIPATIIGTL